MILALWSVSAARAACPVPFTEIELRSLVAQSKQAVFDDDPLGHKRVFAEFLGRVPCLDHQLPRDAYAQLLLDEAIVRYVGKASWEQPLGTALTIFQDLPGVPKYLTEGYLPPLPFRRGDAVRPDDAAIFVDGVLVTTPEIPVVPPEHIVQVWRDGDWHSVYLDESHPAIPPEWIAPKPKEVIEVERPDTAWKPSGRGGIGVSFGIAVANQLVDFPGTYLPDSNAVGGAGGIVTAGVQPI
ncbi:MAG: hypothetical protein ABMB14_41195, partial [Myxococcota bacterium]